jgi:cytosine/adenosine deaminase-related metal-dependent hydrolase
MRNLLEARAAGTRREAERTQVDVLFAEGLDGSLLVEPYASPQRTSIGISQGSIAEVGEDGAAIVRGAQTRVIQANGRMALPGLINAHTHLLQTLLRGLGDELPGGTCFAG